MNRLRMTIIGSSLAILGRLSFGGATLHVDDDAPNDPGPGTTAVSDAAEDGSSEHPFDAIQEAIDAAIDGDVVMVHAGTYTGTGNRDLSFGGRDILVTSEGEPSGDPAQCIIDAEGAGRGVLFVNGETENAELRGFTITNGVGAPSGGGIHCVDASPKITNCIVRQCAASSGGGLSIDGGAVVVTFCTFELNTAEHSGAGARCRNGETTIDWCTFTDNIVDASGQGGGGAWFDGDDGSMAHCTLTGNSAPRGAAVGFVDGSSLSGVFHCTVRENTGILGAVYLEDMIGAVAESDISANNGSGIWMTGGSPWIFMCTIDDNVADGAAGVDCWSDAEITGCTFSGNDAGSGYGGAVRVNGLSPTLSGCTFESNSAHQGGGVYVAPYATPDIEVCTFESNTATLRGGGLCLRSDASMNSCQFRANVTDGEGGGLWTNGNVSLSSSAFVDNEADHGGGILLDDDGSLDLSVVTFDGNVVHVGGGGGLDARSGSVVTDILGQWRNNTAASGGGAMSLSGATVDLQYSTIEDNSGSNALGGAVRLNGGSIVLTGCRVTGNHTGGFGGAMDVRNGQATIVGSIIADNDAPSGGGIAAGAAQLTIAHASFAGNDATYEFGWGGGALFLDDTDATLVNTILWSNTSANGGHELALYDDSSASLSHGDVQGGPVEIATDESSTLDWGPGNLTVDPQWVDPGAGDYHLAASSPVVNRGDDDAVPLPAYDLDGDARILHCRTDMGADESPSYRDCNDNGNADACDIENGTSFDVDGNGVPDECVFATCDGDVDGDGSVDLSDLLAVLSNWGPCAACAADLDGDGTVGFSDLLEVLGAWGTCG